MGFQGSPLEESDRWTAEGSPPRGGWPRRAPGSPPGGGGVVHTRAAVRGAQPRRHCLSCSVHAEFSFCCFF